MNERSKSARRVIIGAVKCPFCKKATTKVLETRILEDGMSVRRRRSCPNPECGQRFTTVETIPIYVRKNNGSLESFDREKVKNGVRKAFGNRPINEGDLDALARQVEDTLRVKNKPEVSSREIGMAILDPLRDMDSVVYLRFASVYQNFRTIADFEKAIEDLKAYRQAERPAGE